MKKISKKVEKRNNRYNRLGARFPGKPPVVLEIIQPEILPNPVENKPEILQKEQIMDKLILDQPDRITTEGRVETVLVSPTLPLNETPVDPTKEKEVLINEDPMDGIEIVLNE
jgi:hypothetical protein